MSHWSYRARSQQAATIAKSFNEAKVAKGDETLTEEMMADRFQENMKRESKRQAKDSKKEAIKVKVDKVDVSVKAVAVRPLKKAQATSSKKGAVLANVTARWFTLTW